MNASGKSKSKKQPKSANRAYISEYAAPEVRWLENVECPDCGSTKLMDARGIGLCVSCNKFVRPKKSKG